MLTQLERRKVPGRDLYWNFSTQPNGLQEEVRAAMMFQLSLVFAVLEAALLLPRFAAGGQMAHVQNGG